MKVDLNPDFFDEVLSNYLRECIESISEDNSELFGPAEKDTLIQAMKITHDWFAKPSEWFYK